MAEHEITLTTIYELLLEHTARFDRMDQRFDGMETVQNAMALRLLSVEATVKEHSAILRTLQIRMEMLHGLVEELERGTGRIEQEYVLITEALRRLEQRFDKIEADRLRERIAALEARVQARNSPGVVSPDRARARFRDSSYGLRTKVTSGR